MTVKYSTKKEQLTITLSWTEARQFLSGCGVREIIDACKELLSSMGVIKNSDAELSSYPSAEVHGEASHTVEGR